MNITQIFLNVFNGQIVAVRAETFQEADNKLPNASHFVWIQALCEDDARAEGLKII